MNLSIIIPIYNEETTISEVVERIQALELVKKELVESWEIVMVDDCSTDNSNEIALQLANSHENISLVTHEKNKGKGMSIRTGVKQATGDLVLFQDADVELYPEDIPLLLEKMNVSGKPFINGNRFAKGKKDENYSAGKYYGNRIFSVITSILTRKKIIDMASGYKLISKTLYERIDPQEDRFSIEAELLIKALKIDRNCMEEVPVRYEPRNKAGGKKLQSSDAIKVLFKIFKLGLFTKVK